nr:FecR domain-containing protein [Pseudomonas sp.]
MIAFRSIKWAPARLLFLVSIYLLPSTSYAQPAGAQGDDFIYNVRPGDTLLQLSQQYTGSPANWKALQRLNAVQDATMLPIGMTLRIPFSMIPEISAQAHVTHIAGQVAANGQAVQNGVALKEGDLVHTGPNGFLTLELADNSTLTIPANSAVRLERVRVFRDSGLTDTVLTVDEGSLESEVAPQDTGVGRFEVRTPVSVTSVRGTKLRVRAQPQGTQTEVLAGVAESGTRGGLEKARLTHGQGGAVDANGKWLGVRRLLAAPVLSTPTNDGEGWALSFTPVAGATAYLVQVADDPAGSRLHSSECFMTPDITFQAPRAGTYYLLVRSADQDGVMGPDATLSFLSEEILRTFDGSPVFSGFGQRVLLTET